MKRPLSTGTVLFALPGLAARFLPATNSLPKDALSIVPIKPAVPT